MYIGFIKQNSPIVKALRESQSVAHISNIYAIEGRISERWQHANRQTFRQEARVVLGMVDVDIEFLDTRREFLQFLLHMEEETPEYVPSRVNPIF